MGNDVLSASPRAPFSLCMFNCGAVCRSGGRSAPTLWRAGAIPIVCEVHFCFFPSSGGSMETWQPSSTAMAKLAHDTNPFK